ncbi:MAG: hypothetical protein KatS3mg101_0848 [Patescibacteria group bacterium]|nr:MAG: hypothetical protein KatS3mg101_0848 [Patescibacteria group bacterium]
MNIIIISVGSIMIVLALVALIVNVFFVKKRKDKSKNWEYAYYGIYIASGLMLLLGIGAIAVSFFI